MKQKVPIDKKVMALALSQLAKDCTVALVKNGAGTIIMVVRGLGGRTVHVVGNLGDIVDMMGIIVDSISDKINKGEVVALKQMHIEKFVMFRKAVLQAIKDFKSLIIMPD